jgi:hypothetical protein
VDQGAESGRALAALKMEYVLEPVSFKLTESGNAERLVDHHVGRFSVIIDSCHKAAYHPVAVP